LRKTMRTFLLQYPGLKIVGFRNGYFTQAEEGSVVEEIRQSDADILFVAMGSPQKEYFLHQHREAMSVPFSMGVGGSFDVVAGVSLRAPMWMQKAGLEWFYRFLNEPGRLWKRYLVTNAVFLTMIVRGLFARRAAV
jgi:N-acetylglucosaminyldiphosphoundecaprenol N-acetyl-beta-D-mannosaminyltransferase